MNQLIAIQASFGAALPETPPLSAVDALQSRFALRVTAALTERSLELDTDLTARLRFAREKALERARASRGSAAPVASRTSRFGGAGSGRWLKLASVLPVIALVAGLVLIQRWQESAQITTAAEVDTALLSDDLPPNAYRDAGFAEFLKTPGE